MSLGHHPFTISSPITSHHSNSNCVFLTDPCADTQSFGSVTHKACLETHRCIFPAGLLVALAPIMLSTTIFLSVLWVDLTNTEAIEEMTSRNTNTIGAVQRDLTSPHSAEEREAESCWCEQELCGFEPTLNHHIYLKQG